MKRNHLSVIDGAQDNIRKPYKDTAIFSSYIDRSGKKALFCEAQRYTIIFAFFSDIFNKYVIVTLNTNKRFNRLKKEDIPLAWEKTFYDGDIGPEKYGRCFLSDTFEEAVKKAFYILHKLLFGNPEIMPDSERSLCIQSSMPLIHIRTKEIIGLID